ncbi:hypothetical protein GGR58DRAFT_80355 [Xylaria digitata]|nr:hypothetical protein GGR58DRAFT_80355 [Xylaria digitata]
MAGSSADGAPALQSDAIDPILTDEEIKEWEDFVQKIDFTLPQYRKNAYVRQIPWTRLSRHTRYLVARQITSATMHDPKSQTREANQCCRKLWLDQATEFVDWAVEKPAIMARLAPNETTWDNPAARTFPTQFPPTGKYHDERGKGSYTFAIKLNPLIAHTWHSKESNPTAANGKPFPVGDPHPACPVPLPDVESMTPFQVAQNVAAFLNATGTIVASVRDKTDDDPKRLIEQLVVRGMEEGDPYELANAHVLDLADDEWESDDDILPHDQRNIPAGYPLRNKTPPSPTKKPEPFKFTDRALAETTIRDLAQIIIGIMTTGKDAQIIQRMPPELVERVDIYKPLLLVQKVRRFAPQGLALDQIHNCVLGIPSLLARLQETRGLTLNDVVEIQKRTEFAVRAHVLGAQIDPLSFTDLPLVRPRYLTWSVSEDPYTDLRHVRSTDYANCPAANVTRPIDMYRWTGLEVASPVFENDSEAKLQAVLESLTTVCQTLKHRLRAHHCALPTLDGTTSIFVGHTEGFTLLELKKLVTLWFIVEPELRYLHRARRDTYNGQVGCRPLRYYSRLGMLCSQPLDQPLNDPHQVMPHPSQEQREFIRWQMHDHFACRPFFENIEAGSELYLRAVWLYSTVSELSRALEIEHKPHNTSLVIRCHGRGQRTSRLRDVKETMFRVNNPQDIYPSEVDEHRGVIEFRQMGRSLDPNHIMAWAHICGTVVTAARETNSVTFREIVSMFTDVRFAHLSAWDILTCTDFAKDQFGPRDRDRGHYYRPRKNGTVDYNYPFYTTPEEPLIPLLQGQPTLNPFKEDSPPGNSPSNQSSDGPG